MKRVLAVLRNVAYALLMAVAVLALAQMVVAQHMPQPVDRYTASGRTADVQPFEPMPSDWLPNSGDAAALDKLPGIGEVYAKRIIEYRETEGPFFFPEDLMLVKGIGESRFRDIMEYLEALQDADQP